MACREEFRSDRSHIISSEFCDRGRYRNVRLRNRHLLKTWKRKQEAYKVRHREEIAAAAPAKKK
jgi:hypothetical protein